MSTLMRNNILAFPKKKKSKHRLYSVQLKRRRKGTEKKEYSQENQKSFFLLHFSVNNEQTAEPPFKYGNRNRFVVCTDCLTVSCVLSFSIVKYFIFSFLEIKLKISVYTKYIDLSILTVENCVCFFLYQMD